MTGKNPLDQNHRLLLRKNRAGELIHIGENDSLVNLSTGKRFARLVKRKRK